MMQDPHLPSQIHAAGTPLREAEAAVVLLHGRGATAQSILELSLHLRREKTAYLAPQAEGSAWYPYSFLEPLERNEPGLSSALACVGRVVDEAVRAGIPLEKIALGGFSQGACLTLEYAVRNPARYGAVLAFSGGLIGPSGTARNTQGSFGGTPVFLGCSDVDFHIPLAGSRSPAHSF